MGHIFNRENVMRWVKNGERTGDVQGFDELNRSVLLASHYQAML